MRTVAVELYPLQSSAACVCNVAFFRANQDINQVAFMGLIRINDSLIHNKKAMNAQKVKQSVDVRDVFFVKVKDLTICF